MSVLGWILLCSTACGLLGPAAASLLLLLPERLRSKLVPELVSFAIGALLGAGLLGLLPEALATAGPDATHRVTATVLAGILAFFVLEKLVRWHHCHRPDCASHEHVGASKRAAAFLVVVGDGLHNFVDGLLIATAFLSDARLGATATVAVLAHEIPQELGDFVILLNSGMSPRRAVLLNVVSGLTMPAGALAGYVLGDFPAWLPYFVAIGAASFIYVAVADLMPAQHDELRIGRSARQLGLILAGLGIMLALTGHEH